MNNNDSQQQSNANDDADTSEPEKLPLRHVLTSVFAAAIGVQNKKNQEKDFNAKGSIYIYIAAGIIFTFAFVVTVALVVKAVLANAG